MDIKIHDNFLKNIIEGKTLIMNRYDDPYKKYALIREMLETVELVKNFDIEQTKTIAEKVQLSKKLLLTGEGSSRIFPAKNARKKALIKGVDIKIITEGGRQAEQYDLSKFTLFCASNSGRTKEVILFADQFSSFKQNIIGFTSSPNSLLEKKCGETIIFKCGSEKAVAATKSVVELGLLYDSVLFHLEENPQNINFSELANKIETCLTLPIDPQIINAVAKAETLYFAGYNDGVAEELTLKANEILQKRSDYLEGTYAVHGIEEVMTPNDVVLIFDPIESELDKFYSVLTEGVGLKVIAISTKPTQFPTIQIPDAGLFSGYMYLTAGWNLLVETGLALGVQMDSGERARKVGNEFVQ
jgi:glucosamine--fructose-6-phosphate aminotransferase (isomerizing)